MTNSEVSIKQGSFLKSKIGVPYSKFILRN